MREHASIRARMGAVRARTDAHELLGLDLVSFIEDDADFALVGLELLEDGAEFVGDVELRERERREERGERREERREKREERRERREERREKRRSDARREGQT